MKPSLKLLRIGLYILSFLILVLAAVHTPPFRKYTLGKLSVFLRSSAGIDLRANSLRYNLLFLSAELDEIELRSAYPGDPTPFVKADSVRVKLSPFSLLREKPILDSVGFENLRIRIIDDSQGSGNLPTIPPGDNKTDENRFSGLSIPIFIKHLTVRHGSFHYTNGAQGLGIELPIWALDIKGDPSEWVQSLHFQTVESGQAELKNHILPIDRLHLGLELYPGKLKLQELKLEFGESRLKADATMEGFENPAVESSITADLDVGKLLGFLGLSQSASGVLRISATVSGKAAQTTASAHISGTNILYKGIDDVDLSASAAWEEKTKRIRIDSLEIVSPQGSISGQAEIALSKEHGASSISAQFRSIDLENITRHLLPVRIASRVDGTIKARWHGMNFGQAEAQANLKLTAAPSRLAPKSIPISALIQAGMREGNVDAEIVSGKCMDLEIKGNVSIIAWKALRGRIKAETDSLGGVIGSLEAFLDSSPGTLVGTLIDGPLTFNAELGGTLQALRLAGKADGRDIHIGNLSQVNLDAEVVYSPEIITFSNVKAVWHNQFVAADGEIGFGEKSNQLNLAARVDGGSIEAVVAGLGKSWPIEGDYSLKVEVGGTTEDIDISTHVSASGLKAFGQNLGGIDLQADMAGDQINLAHLALVQTLQDREYGRLDIKGTFAMDTGAYAFQADASGLRFNFAATDLPVLPAMRGELGGSASGSGSLDMPSVHANLDLNGFHVDGREIGEIGLEAQLGQEHADILVRVPRYALVGKAGIGTGNPYPARIEAEIDADVSQSGIRILDDEPLNGHVAATFLWSGNLVGWEEGEALLHAVDLQTSIRHQKFFNQGPVDLYYKNRLLNVRSMNLVAGNSNLSIQGSLPIESQPSPDALEIEGQVDLSELAPLLGLDTITAEGILVLDGSLGDSLLQMDPDLRLTLAEGRFNHPALKTSLESIGLEIFCNRDAIELRSMSARLGSAAINMTGAIPLHVVSAGFPTTTGVPQSPAWFTAVVEDLRVEDFIHTINGAVTGTVGFHLEGETRDLSNLEAMQAQLTFDQFLVQSSEYGLRQEEPIRLSMMNGKLVIDHFLLSAPTTRIHAAGSLELQGDQNLDIDVDGNINIGIATLLSRDFKAEGDSRIEIDLHGTLSDPEVSGFFELKEGGVTLQTPSLSVTELEMRLSIDEQSLNIEKCTGNLNGGEMKISGTTQFGSSGFLDAKIDASIEDAFLNYPDGFRARVSGDFTLRSEEDFMVLGGSIRLLEGMYRKQLDLVQELLDRLQSDKSIQFSEEETPFLSRLRFNLKLETPNGIIIDTNLAELVANGDMRLTGSYYRTGLVGRVNLQEGGQIRFHERTYLVERGVISFINETRIEPSLDILASTQVAGYDISLKLSGTPDDLKAKLSSDPTLSQPDIIALLLTGRELQNLQGSGLNIAREQVESYLSGQMAQFLSKSAEDAVGLSLVRIDPSLISPEANPGARLTVGDDITNSLFLIYSMNLVDASDRIITVKYDITRNFQAEMTRQNDNSYRFVLGQDIRFGSPREETTGGIQKKKLQLIEFSGDTVLPQAQLLDKLGVVPGDTYDFFKIQKGLERLRDYFGAQGNLENQIQLEKTEDDQNVNLSVVIEAGPVVEIQYSGWTPPGDTKQRVTSAWAKGFFDAQRIQQAERELRASLAGRGYLQAKTDTSVLSPSPGTKTVTFSIDVGAQFPDVEMEFAGAFGFPPYQLRKILENENLLREIHSHPEAVIEFLRRYYYQHGYLSANIQNPQYVVHPGTGTGKIVIPIHEGPRFSIRNITFEGNTVLTDAQIIREIPLAAGEIYNPETLRTAVDRIEKLYWTHGYNNVLLDYALRRSEDEDGTLDILFQVSENNRQFVEEIIIEGSRKTTESMIRSQMTLEQGDILDYRETNKSRSHLYDTRAYTFVDIQSNPFSGPQLPSEADRRPVQLKVTVKEFPPFHLTYSGFYDTERGAGGIADFSNRNSLGSARLIGTRVRYDSDIKEVRGYFSQPTLRRFPMNTDLTGYLRKEFVGGEDHSDIGFSTDTIGFTLQQEVQFNNKFILNYGYRFEHKELEDRTVAPSIKTIQNNAPLTVTLTRESRNKLLDSWKGSFTSQAFEYAPSFLGSDLRSYKYFGQYFHYLPLSAPTKVPWTQDIRSRLVFAGGLRVGIAGGLDGQHILTTDKFFAGGGTTIRGFDQNEVGPRSPEGIPMGGNALFIINSELRFPIFKIVDGVGFLDIGNVYPKIADFDPTDVRASAGFGLRLRTPYFLLRADYGFKLDREPGESQGKLFFSIGQAF